MIAGAEAPRTRPRLSRNPNRPIRPAPAAHAVASPPPRRQANPADPCAMVLFGATGDLAKRLVMLALYNLSRTKVLPEKFALIGVGRTKETAASWGGHLYEMLKSFVGDTAAEFDIDHIDEAVWKRLAARISYVQGDLTTLELYEKLRGALDEAARPMALRATSSSILAVADPAERLHQGYFSCFRSIRHRLPVPRRRGYCRMPRNGWSPPGQSGKLWVRIRGLAP